MGVRFNLLGDSYKFPSDNSPLITNNSQFMFDEIDNNQLFLIGKILN